MIKIVFVGAGAMGQMAHLRNYAMSPDCRVIALVEARTELGQAVARRYGIPRVFESVEAFRAAGMDFDGFVSAQPYRNQKNLMPQLYAFGKPVLSEKPIALAVETGRELSRLAEERGVTHVVGYHKRSDPAMEYAADLAARWRQSGRFGEFRYLRATMPAGDWVVGGFDGMIKSDEAYPPCQWEPDVGYFPEAEYNKLYDTFVNYYIHQINAVGLLLDEDYRIAYAEKTRTMLAGQSQSGKPAVIEMSPWQNTVDWQESYLLAFDKGWIRIELPAPLTVNCSGRVTVCEDSGEGATPITWSPSLPHVDAMKNQAANYVRFLCGEIAPKCTARQAVRDLELAREYVTLLREAQ